MEMMVYTHVTNPGGVDGKDHNDKGGVTTAAFSTRLDAEQSPNAPWCEVVPLVVDTAKVRRDVLAKLSPVERLILGHDKPGALLAGL